MGTDAGTVGTHGYVPKQAMAFGSDGGPATAVTATNPLPVAPTLMPARAATLAGTIAASGSIGPFTPDPGRAIWLTLTGSWTGTVTVQRSIDGGATRLPLTAGGQPWAVFTANANEPIGEEGVAGAGWWLAVTLSSGTLAYRVQQ